MDQSKCVIEYFVTKYYTKWGVRIVVTGDGEALGENRVEKCVLQTRYFFGFRISYPVLRVDDFC